MILRVKKFSKQYGTNVLFTDVNLVIHEGNKIALIGKNGTGKSTFIKCLVGDESYDGLVELKKDLKISVMEQERDFEQSEQNFSDYLKEKKDKIQKRIEACEKRMADPDIYDNIEEFEHLMGEYETLIARTTEKIEEKKIRDILEELGFEMQDYEKEIGSLSGGQRTKLRISECLSKNADLIILDEPTNHLDLDSLKWLENYLSKLDKDMLIVSHDRFFLNKIVNKVLEIEDKHFEVYDGSYEDFKIEREKHLGEITKQYSDNERERKRLAASEKETRAWAKVRFSRKLRRRADELKRRLEAMPVLTNPEEFERNFDFNFIEGNPPSKFIISANDIVKSFGNVEVLKKANLVAHRWERVAIKGPNGSGKSTLLKILAGVLEADSGKVEKGLNVEIGYFDQELRDIDQNQRVRDFFFNNFPQYKDHKLISLAVRFGFPVDKLGNRIKNLSGGEKARLNLVRLMLKKCNVLLLDEPTNNLDLQLIENLEESLNNYPGTVIFVSHDRYFVNRIAERVIEINNGVIGDEQ